MALRALYLCDGYGGFELALRLAGLDVQAVARVERDSHAAAVLVARMADSTLDRAPVWDDLETFNGTALRGRVDIITAGFPCQPFSTAGTHGGVDDKRWLWPHIARITADVGPRLVFVENVTGLVRRGLPHVLADLADLGFDAEWGCLSAASVGAPHRRDRFWLLAHRYSHGLEGVGGEPAGSQQPRHHPDGPSGSDVADTESVGDGARFGPGTRASRWLQEFEARRRELDWPPGPHNRDEWDNWRSQGGPEPSIRRSTHGRPVGLVDALHLGGNGLVPRVAAEAFTALAVRAGIARTVER